MTQFWTAKNEKADLHSRDVKSPLNIQMLFISGSKSIQREVNMCMAELVIHRVFFDLLKASLMYLYNL